MSGEWDGEVFYTYADGPRAGKKDVERWQMGKLISSQKFYGEGQTLNVENWEDLNKLEELTQSCNSAMEK